jgi:hypothetical protein
LAAQPGDPRSRRDSPPTAGAQRAKVLRRFSDGDEHGNPMA